jgi:large subunit ribosomal protein L28
LKGRKGGGERAGGESFSRKTEVGFRGCLLLCAGRARPQTPSCGAVISAGKQAVKIRLTHPPCESTLSVRNQQSPFMSKVCSITGARPSRGHVIHRRGLAKKKGGIGQHVTAMTPRVFTPNLKVRRLWVPELSKFVKLKLSARALKTVAKNGAFATLKKAGLL